MVVNIGADTTEISVLSLGGIVLSKAVKFGGNKLDSQIISAVRKNIILLSVPRQQNILNVSLEVQLSRKRQP